MKKVLTFILIIVGIFALGYYQLSTNTTSSTNNTSNIIYVNTSNSASGDGSSWHEAFLTLEEALEVADANNEIWVVGNDYCPINSDACVQIIDGISVYSGFIGNETSLDERVLDENTPTLLENSN